MRCASVLIAFGLLSSACNDGGGDTGDELEDGTAAETPAATSPSGGESTTLGPGADSDDGSTGETGLPVCDRGPEYVDDLRLVSVFDGPPELGALAGSERGFFVCGGGVARYYLFDPVSGRHIPGGSAPFHFDAPQDCVDAALDAKNGRVVVLTTQRRAAVFDIAADGGLVSIQNRTFDWLQFEGESIDDTASISNFTLDDTRVVFALGRHGVAQFEFDPIDGKFDIEGRVTHHIGQGDARDVASRGSSLFVADAERGLLMVDAASGEVIDRDPGTGYQPFESLTMAPDRNALLALRKNGGVHVAWIESSTDFLFDVLEVARAIESPIVGAVAMPVTSANSRALSLRMVVAEAARVSNIEREKMKLAQTVSIDPFPLDRFDDVGDTEQADAHWVDAIASAGPGMVAVARDHAIYVYALDDRVQGAPSLFSAYRALRVNATTAQGQEQGPSASRVGTRVPVFNRGNRDLFIRGWDIDPPFEVLGTEGAVPVAGCDGVWRVPSGTSFSIWVGLAEDAGTAAVTGRLAIESNDPDQPTAHIELYAHPPSLHDSQGMVVGPFALPGYDAPSTGRARVRWSSALRAHNRPLLLEFFDAQLANAEQRLAALEEIRSVTAMSAGDELVVVAIANAQSGPDRALAKAGLAGLDAPVLNDPGDGLLRKFDARPSDAPGVISPYPLRVLLDRQGAVRFIDQSDQIGQMLLRVREVLSEQSEGASG